MFKCKSCPCKDAHIADLQKTIEFLKRQLQPSPNLPSVNLEANYVMDGANSEQIEVFEEVSAEKAREMEKVSSEETAILMGEYEFPEFQ